MANKASDARIAPNQEIRTASPERSPGAVAHVSDDWLNDQSGQRRGQPKKRKLAFVSAKIFVDGGHVPHLQAPAELDAKKSETHVPDLPEAEARFRVHAVITAITYACLGRKTTADARSRSTKTNLQVPEKLQSPTSIFQRG